MRAKLDKIAIIKEAQRAIDNKTPTTFTTIAKHTGRGRDYVSRVITEAGLYERLKTIPVPILDRVEENGMKLEMKQQRKERRDAISKIRELQTELLLRDELDKISKTLVVRKIDIVEEEGKKEATAITVASDWHYEEEIRAEAVGGVNKFNQNIANNRIGMYFERTLKLLNMCRHESSIEKMVVFALGDFITGWIHEDLISPTTPPEALASVLEQWVSGLQFWLDNAELKELIVICACGNHGRITRRPQYKKRQEKNYEWLLYQFLVKWFSRYVPGSRGKIRFVLPSGQFNWITLYGKKIRAHHGDGIRYMGGIGGLHIPLRKAIAQWNKAQHADLDVLGHWHTRKVDYDYVVNGSLIGYGEFSEQIKADFEPPSQCFFLMHPKYGKTAEFSIRLD